MLVNNGKYRRTELEFIKIQNGIPVTNNGFPFSVSILNSFAEYPAITEEEFSSLSNQDYQIRLNAFYNYLQLTYSFFDIETHVPNINNSLINSNGDDIENCPINNSPLFNNYITLDVEYFNLSNGVREAIVKAKSVDHLGNPYVLPFSIDFTFILKEFFQNDFVDWDNLNGQILNAQIISGESEVVLVERFRFKGEDNNIIPFKSVYVQLLELFDEGISFKSPKSVIINMVESAYLLNFISNINSSYQDLVKEIQANEIANNSKGAINTGKKDFHFVFEPNSKQRPVLIYPSSWGDISQIIFKQGGDINLINDNVFQLTNGKPYVYNLNVNGSSINYNIYSASNLIIYPYKADYYFKF